MGNSNSSTENVVNENGDVTRMRKSDVEIKLKADVAKSKVLHLENKRRLKEMKKNKKKRGNISLVEDKTDQKPPFSDISMNHTIKTSLDEPQKAETAPPEVGLTPPSTPALSTKQIVIDDSTKVSPKITPPHTAELEKSELKEHHPSESESESGKLKHDQTPKSIDAINSELPKAKTPEKLPAEPVKINQEKSNQIMRKPMINPTPGPVSAPERNIYSVPLSNNIMTPIPIRYSPSNQKSNFLPGNNHGVRNAAHVSSMKERKPFHTVETPIVSHNFPTTTNYTSSGMSASPSPYSPQSPQSHHQTHEYYRPVSPERNPSPWSANNEPNRSGTTQKKKLIVRGLKRYKETRKLPGPPMWVKEFPCRSRYHVDNYIYDFETGQHTQRGSIAAMESCPKKGGRCDRCGIYCGEICQSCRRCGVDCQCRTTTSRRTQNQVSNNFSGVSGITGDPTEPLGGMLSQADKLLSDFQSKALPSQYPFNSGPNPTSSNNDQLQGQYPMAPPPPPYYPSSMPMMYPPCPYPYSPFLYPYPTPPFGMPYPYPNSSVSSPFFSNSQPSPPTCNDYIGVQHPPSRASIPSLPTYQRQYSWHNR